MHAHTHIITFHDPARALPHQTHAACGLATHTHERTPNGTEISSKGLSILS